MSKAKKFAIYLGIIVLTIGFAITGQFIIQRFNFVYAARSRPAYTDESSCVSGSGAASVESVQDACHLCFNSGRTVARGTLWFNSSSSERDSDIVRVSDPNAVTADVYLWGQTFACGDSPDSSTAYHVWFGRKDKDTSPSTEAVPYLVPNDASTSKYRGEGDCISTGCYSYVWTTPVPPDSGWTLKVQEFKNDPDTVKTITAAGLERYEAKVSVNRCYHRTKNNISYYSKSRTDCYGENSHIVLEIAPADNSGFSSKSRVVGSGGTKVSSDWGIDDAGTLEMEADSSGSATVYFAHILRYRNSSPDGNSYEQASTTGTITFDDGSGDTYTVPFSAPGDSSGVDSGWKTSDAGIEKTITLGTGEDSKTVCSTITYTTKTVQWSNAIPHVAQPVNDSGSTKACVKITRSQTESAGGITFWSRSHVESVAANDVNYHKASTYDNFSGSTKIDGDEVTLRLSTDYDTAKANFRHDLGFEIKLDAGMSIGANDTVDYTNMCTTWTIESDTSKNGASGSYCANTYYTGHSTDVSTTMGHTISIGSAAGSVGSAKEKIKYEKKTIPILREEIKTNACGTTPESYTCSYNPKRWKYYAEAGTGTGSGNSAAKIEYVRPYEPEESVGPSSGATTSSDPMYAGETQAMRWDGKAKAIDERRILAYQSVAFLVKVNVPTTSTKGNIGQIKSARSDIAPCTYWASRFALRENCVQVDAGNDELNKTYSYVDAIKTQHSLGNKERNMVIPNWVGDKYCNSFAYRWGYYYGVMNTKGNNAGNWKWEFDNRTYWTHYNSACRAIAKKPSVALWNGGLFVGEGHVLTSVAPRYNSTAVGTIATGNTGDQRFGSWTEYLATVKGSVTGPSMTGLIPGAGGIVSRVFASGGAFAWNGSTETEHAKNSTLTIQNANTSNLGYSGVPNNSAFLDRLDLYFQKAQTHSESTIGGITVNDQRIYYVNGNVTINGDIKLATGQHSIYQLPQVVIFATGDINITENVTQIDAWLISKNGKVDTCYNTSGSSSAFVSGETQANVSKGLSGGSNPDTRSNSCQKELKINGPVVAKTVTTNRSFGADGTANYDEDSDNAPDARAVTSEVFNLSADAYLWAYAHASRYSSSYTEAYSRELPPRY